MIYREYFSTTVVFRQENLLLADAENMDSPRFLKGIGGEPLLERVVGVRRDENISAGKTHHDGGVVKIARGAPELHNIADFQPIEWYFLGKRACAAVVAYEKVVEVFHARPRGRSVVDGAIKPTEGGGKVHDARARIDALRGKVGAVAADGVKIVIVGVSSVCPAPGVLHRGNSVIGKSRHSAIV